MKEFFAFILEFILSLFRKKDSPEDVAKRMIELNDDVYQIKDEVRREMNRKREERNGKEIDLEI